MAKYPCLGDDLEGIVLSLDEVCFDFLSDEPSIDESMEYLKSKYPEMNEEELQREAKEYYKIIVQMYHGDQKIAGKLYEYGRTREEMIRSVKIHLNECDKCKEAYLQYLDHQAERELSWARKKGIMDERIRGLAERFLSRGYSGLIKKMDVLGFLKD